MKRSLSLILLTALPGFAADPKPVPAEQLIANAFESPGSYDQMCAMAVIDGALPFPLYHTVMPRHFHLSEKSLRPLRERRAEVVPALAKIIGAIQPGAPEEKKTRPAEVARKPLKFSDFAAHSGISPREVSGLLLEVVDGLNAIEALPGLLALEERLDVALNRAEKDPSIPPPVIDRDGMAFVQGGPALTPGQAELRKGRVMQQEMLSMMLKLLRGQRFQPLLDSEFEQAFATAIKKRAAESDLREIATPEDARRMKMEGITFDPIYHVPLTYGRPTIPYTPELRDKARALVADFIATVPRASWKTSPP